MVKKTKKKGKLAKEQDQQGEATVLGANVKDIGMALAGVLVGEVVQIAIDRLLHANHSKPTQTGDNHDSQPGHHNPIEQATSTLHSSFDDTKPVIRDALHAVRSVVSEMTPDLNDVLGNLKDITQRSALSSVETVENTTGRTIGGAVDTAKTTAKTVINALNADVDRNSSKKKGKKKKNKKDKK